MTTPAALVQDARNLLFGTQRSAVNFLSADPTNGASIALSLDASNIVAGDYIECAFESMLVTAVSGSTLTVHRGMDGTTINTMIPVGTLVRVRPIVTDFTLFRFMQSELADLSAPMNGLYRVRTVDINISAGSANGYDLTFADATTLIKARASNRTNDWARASGVHIETSMADFTSGVGLFVSEATAGRTLRVWVRAPFGAVTTASTNVETDSGLPATATDLLVIGAAYRTMIGREAARSQFENQGDTRRAGEVPPGAQRQGLTPFVALRASRIAAEKARLDAAWPIEKD